MDEKKLGMSNNKLRMSTGGNNIKQLLAQDIKAKMQASLMKVKTYGGDPLSKSTSSKNLNLGAGSKDELTAALDNLKASYQSKNDMHSATMRKTTTDRMSITSGLGMKTSPKKVPATPIGGSSKSKKLTTDDLNATGGRRSSRIGLGLGLQTQS